VLTTLIAFLQKVHKKVTRTWRLDW